MFFYEFDIQTTSPVLLDGYSTVYLKIDSPDAYVKANEQYNLSGLLNTKKHFSKNNFCSLLFLNNEVVSSGWCAWDVSFYIPGLDLSLVLKDPQVCVLYDFMTLPSERGKGYYPLLLTEVIRNNPNLRKFIIYTYAPNTASQKGITKAGFKLVGKFRHASPELKGYLKKCNLTTGKSKHGLLNIIRSDI